MLCPKCGSEVDVVDEFCWKCGLPIRKTDEDKSCLSNLQNDNSKEQSAQTRNFPLKTKKKFNRKALVILIICLSLSIITSIIIITNVKKTAIKHSLYNTYSHYQYDGSGDIVHDFLWVETSYESVLRIRENEDDDYSNLNYSSGIYRFSVTRNIDWEINDNLELVLKYEDSTSIFYAYSDSKVDKKYWHYDEKESKLYIGDNVYRPVDKDEIKETDSPGVYRIADLYFNYT